MPYLAHLILNVSDFDKSIRFYDTLFGKMDISSRTVHNDDHIKIKAYQLPGCPIYIRWDKEAKKHSFIRYPGLDHLCIGVDSRAEIDALHETVAKMQTLITREPRCYPEYTPHYYAFYFRDPDGFPLEFVCMNSTH